MRTRSTPGLGLRYREDKATQAAARFLERAGGSLNVLKLIKLLYFAERLAILRSGRPITFDTLVSMPKGPVLSLTFDKIDDEEQPGAESYWRHHISERSNHEVRLLVDSAPRDQLSEAEEAIIDEVWREHGHKTQWQLVEESHRLPEWRDPGGSSLPLTMADILAAGGFSQTDIEDIESDLRAEQAAARLIGA